MSANYDTLARAAFSNDALADEGHNLDYIMRSLGVDGLDLYRAAEQRAMRFILMQRGSQETARIKAQAYNQEWSMETLTPAERRRMTALIMLWIDGAAIMLRALREDT